LPELRPPGEAHHRQALFPDEVSRVRQPNDPGIITVSGDRLRLMGKENRGEPERR
jgi:hypothetical protein